MTTIRTAPVTVTFGRKVRELRNARGWTLKQMAPLVPVCVPALSRIERGYGTTLDTAGRIADVLGTPLAVMLAPVEAGRAPACRPLGVS